MDAVPRTANLRQSLDHAGYYPELVGDVLDVAVSGEDVVAHLGGVEGGLGVDQVRHDVLAAHCDVEHVAYQLGVVAGVIEALAQVRCSWHGVHPSIRLRLPPRVPGPGVGHAADPASGGKGPSRGVGPTGLG